MGVPILRNHDTSDHIGSLSLTIMAARGRLVFELYAPITREMFFEIFPTAGVKFKESEFVDGVMMVKAGEILEFSLIADKPPEPPPTPDS